jgi:hypothetical protein
LTVATATGTMEPMNRTLALVGIVLASAATLSAAAPHAKTIRATRRLPIQSEQME